MAKARTGFKVRLDPKDEYPHDPGSAKNYNESMYFNVFDPAKMTGGWFRIGNRPNEQYAETSVCLYLPDGRVGFMFARPAISGNAEMNAGGLRVDVVEPFKHLRVSYSGDVLLLSRPHDMANPKKAFAQHPRVACTVALDYEGVSPMFGGETTRDDGSTSIRKNPSPKRTTNNIARRRDPSRSARSASTFRASGCATSRGVPGTGKPSNGIAGAQ